MKFSEMSVPLDIVIDALADASMKDNGSLNAAETTGSAAGYIAGHLVNTKQIEFLDAFFIIRELINKRREKRGESVNNVNT